MKKILILLVASFAISGLSADSETLIKQLKYVRGLEQEKASTGAVYRFPLDRKVYENSRGTIGGFRDLRLFAGDKAVETPYKVRKKYFTATKTYRVNCQAKVISLKKLPDNRIEVIIKNLDKVLTPSYLTIETSDRNYDKQIAIENGNDIKWNQMDMKTKCEGVVSSIFDYSSIIDLKNNMVKLPKGEGKFYRIIISNFSETKFSKRMEIIKEQRSGKDFSEIKKILQNKDDFRIDKIILEAEVTKQVPKAPVSEKVEPEILKTEQDGNQTRITLDVYRQPITKLNLFTESVNFSRKVEIRSSDDLENWMYSTAGNISKVAVGDYKKTDLKLNLPENTSKYLLLVIENGDAPLLKDIKVQCYSSVYDVEFLSPNTLNTIKLYYGGDLDFPQYDIDRILGVIENPGYISIILEPEESNPLFSTVTVKKPFWETKTVIYIVIGLMVVILGAGLFKTVKNIDEEDESSSESTYK